MSALNPHVLEEAVSGEGKNGNISLNYWSLPFQKHNSHLKAANS